jgi:hypothetical protein
MSLLPIAASILGLGAASAAAYILLYDEKEPWKDHHHQIDIDDELRKQCFEAADYIWNDVNST